MDEKLYELRTYQHVHGLDVRCVASLPTSNAFVTGSRDKLTKLFVENETTKQFDLGQVYKDAKNFISSLCVLVNDHNESIIYVGSNDGAVYVYLSNSSELQSQLLGHELTVCSINAHHGSQKIVTGSWDKTARVWLRGVESNKLVGHEAAVWTTCFVDEQTVLTGSADKTVKVWQLNNSSTCIRTIQAHSDCVRDLKLVGTNQFISCANDALIKRWNLDGTLIEQYEGHENYIYSLSVINNDEKNLKFASCSEDKTLRVWQNGKISQSIRLPSQTLWSVCTMKNNDLVVGCSNGNVYIYTQDNQLFAPQSIKEHIDEEIAKTNIPMSELGGIKVDQLPGKERLGTPGKKEGEVQMIKEDNTITAYQWSATKFEWIKVGDVVGNADSSKDPSQKQEYEGKFYDFVFSVDIQEGMPPLKLPFNNDQNPWLVAQQFIDKHELSQGYLDEIANFIVKNSQANSATAASRQPAPMNYDPFTGGSSYRSVTSDSQSTSNSESNQTFENTFYPLKTYFVFDGINSEGITKKLKEFSQIVTDEMKVSSDELQSLLSLTDRSASVNALQLETIKKMMKWPQANLFPVLDFMRIAVFVPKVCDQLLEDASFASTFLEMVLNSVVNHDRTPNQYLSLRCLCNLLHNAAGEQFFESYDQAILSKTSCCLESGNKNVQVALSTLYMNLSLFTKKHSTQELGLKTELTLNSIRMLQSQFDAEAQFRALVALGTMIEQDKLMIDLIRSEELFKFLEKLSDSKSTDKLARCATILHKKIKG